MRTFLLALAGILGLATEALAAHPSELCRRAALGAASAHGIPPAVMLAITDVETGTTRAGARGPWPWTLNVAGRGAWFDSRREALTAAEQALAGGERSFDVGCFQVNFHWHGHHFDSIGAMLDPDIGADYAARFLKDLEAEAGDWLVAAGWYHSRTPVHSNRYRALVARAMERIGPVEPGTRYATAPEAPESPVRRVARNTPAIPLPVTSGGVRLSLFRRTTGALLTRGAP
ncbi:MAG: lytic transglycosylase domain-containing protein [Pseudomonadota bacterium]